MTYPFLALLGVLFILTVLLCVAFALPPQQLNPEHPFEVDPLDAQDHRGRHELAEADETVILPLPPLGRKRI